MSLSPNIFETLYFDALGGEQGCFSKKILDRSVVPGSVVGNLHAISLCNTSSPVDR